MKKATNEFLTMEDIVKALTSGGKMPCSVQSEQKKQYIVKVSGSIFGSNPRKKGKSLEKIL